MCELKLSLLSKVTPRSLTSLESVIGFPLLLQGGFSVLGERHNYCLESTYTKAFGKAPVLNCFDGVLCSLPDDVDVVLFS